MQDFINFQNERQHIIFEKVRDNILTTLEYTHKQKKQVIKKEKMDYFFKISFLLNRK